MNSCWASFPLDDDLRVEVAEVLDRAGLRPGSAALYRTLGFHLANVGRPLRAVVCARTLAAWVAPTTPGRTPAILELVAQAYSAGSPRLAAFAARPSPPDPRAPVQLAPPTDDLQLSERGHAGRDPGR